VASSGSTGEPLDLRTWAEGLVLGDTLADKLREPGAAEDRGGPPLALPDAPGRPAAWAFSSERAPFPKAAELVAPRARGTMLHFFANHELLAIELLALGLLRFPETPARFRAGLVRTILDEQRHLGMYLGRMAELGVAPGEVPVNRFFWDCVHDVESPLDLCVRMGLVFEQANLDFCVEYAARLRAVDDAPTAAILDRILADELGHVQHGLYWFRRWKDPATSDWDAFVQRLHLPLSPARAKGGGVHRELRERVGLDPDFIDRLEVYGRSKGRPPTVWWWNPDCEAERRDPAHRPSAAVAALSRDLAALPWVLARPDDLVLVPAPPRLAWQRHLQAAGLHLPELATEVGERSVGSLEPWGWSPRAEAVLGRLRARQVPAARRPPPAGAAFRKDTAAGWLAAWRPELAWLAGTTCTRWEEVAAAAAELEERGLAPAVKPVLSTAGQGILRRVEEGAVRRLLAQQPAVLVVPWLDRAADLSLHLDVGPERSRVRGFTSFQADARGAWRRSQVGRPELGLEPNTVRLLQQSWPGGLWGLGSELATYLGPKLTALGVTGAVGIDMLLSSAGLLHPLVEINPRWTMGRVALALRPRVAPGVPAWLSLMRDPGDPELLPPLVDARGLWTAGRLWLTDPVGAQVAAVLDVAADPPKAALAG